MKKFFIYRTNIHPLFAIVTSLLIILFGLILANRVYICLIFLVAVYFWLLIMGCYRGCIHILPITLILVIIFSGISYVTTKSIDNAVIMANRVFATTFAIIPGFSTNAVDITRALSQLKMHKSIILGMLIIVSFFPLLMEEIKRIREAMKTRKATSLLKPKIFYRAFLIPCIIRLTTISNLLSLSVETRGFSLEKSPQTVYKKVYLTIFDISIVLGILIAVILILLII